MNRYVNCITINTDASFNHKLKVGSYAFYIICDYFKIQKSGVFKVNPETSEQAEMMCMANAINCLSKRADLPVTKLIVINSDCLFSFKKIGRRSQDKIGRKVANELRKLRSKTAYRDVIYPKFEFRHVKAHVEIKDNRTWVNDWCDKEAKRHMKNITYNNKTNFI